MIRTCGTCKYSDLNIKHPCNICPWGVYAPNLREPKLKLQWTHPKKLKDWLEYLKENDLLIYNPAKDKISNYIEVGEK